MKSKVRVIQYCTFPLIRAKNNSNSLHTIRITFLLHLYYLKLVQHNHIAFFGGETNNFEFLEDSLLHNPISLKIIRQKSFLLVKNCEKANNCVLYQKRESKKSIEAYPHPFWRYSVLNNILSQQVAHFPISRLQFITVFHFYQWWAKL